jgi:nicotinate-nucleotide adenylyltransferase
MRRPTYFEEGTVIIFGGSFDPVTYTHVQVAMEALAFGFADQVWMVPCGMRPDKPTQVSPECRLEMVSLALDAMASAKLPIFVDGTEVDAGRYLPTRELMCVYRSRYPKLKFKVLMGNDLLGSLHTWDDFPDLVRENRFLVYKRICTNDSPRHRVFEDDESDTVHLLDPSKTKLHVERLRDSDGFHPVISNVSSTEVRKRLEMKGPSAVAGLTPLYVVEYIVKHGLYKVRCDS